MRYVTRVVLILLAASVLTGCFESKTSLYIGVTPLQPFHDRTVLTGTDKSKSERILVHEVAPGAYHFVESTDKNSKGNGVYRFYRLPGMPAGNLVVEMEGPINCPSSETAAPKTCPIYIHSVWRLTPGQVETTNPDCAKVARLPGVKMSDDKKNCAFTQRKTLERALRIAAPANLKPNDVLTISQ